MKNLNSFSRFDLVAFLSGKELTVVGCSPWIDFATGTTLGTKVEVAITRDDTEYPPAKDGTPASTNLYEKLAIKVSKAVAVPIGSIIIIVNGIASIYGEYRNQLSIRAEDIKIAPPTPPAKGSEKAA